MDKAIVLVSGGINSAVAAAVSSEQYETAFLHVAWGHRTADRELAAFQQLCGSMKPHASLVLEMDCLAAMGGSARSHKRHAIEDAAALTRSTPGTFMLGLMPSMLGLAACWAGAIQAKRIIIGTGENYDVGGPMIGELYPDHRREFIQAYNLMLLYARAANREISVEAPLLEMNRPDVLRLGQRLDVPFEKTWSCYRTGDRPCGRCYPCTVRAAGFVRAGVPDPLLLEPVGAK
jgi:7-cyano-7-deazaguanine synthase